MKYKKISIVSFLAMMLLFLNACGGSDNSEANANDSENTEAGDISYMWWGSQNRADLMTESIEEFEDDNEIDVNKQFASFEDYWSKLSTQIAGGNAPDIIQMDMRYVRSYADKGVLQDLNDTDIDTSDLDDTGIEAGTYDGEFVAMPTGMNAVALVYDPEMLEEAGIEHDMNERLTWEEFQDIAITISEELPDVAGAQNMIRDDGFLNYFARDKGESLYNKDADGLGLSKETAEEWFEYWYELQEAGGSPSADATAATNPGEHEKYPIVPGDAAFTFVWSNEYETIEDLADRDLAVAMVPFFDNDHEPYWLKASMYMSLSNESGNKEEAADLIDFFTNDERANSIMKVERGVPINSERKDSLLDSGDLTEAQEESVEFVSEVEEIATDAPPFDPGEVQEVYDLVDELGEMVLFEDLTPEQAAETLIEEGNALLDN